jgi:hypothetical protein
MALKNLENLVKTGGLNKEPLDKKEFEGLVASASDRLNDVLNGQLSYASRFDLTYNAAHALALAALRYRGYRSDKRYLVFQCLPHTLGLSTSVTRIFVLCHERRNLSEYEGQLNVDEQLLTELVQETKELLKKIRELK